MKKTLLFGLAITASLSLSAQVLESDNYNSYTIGNVATATNGTTVGQGGMYPYNGTPANFQIVDGGATHGKYLQVVCGSDGTAASARYVFKNGLGTAWAARTAGNNIIKGTVDIFTGTSTNKHASGVAVFGATSGLVGIRYNSDTKTINGLAYLQPTTGAAAFYGITGLTTATFPANTWISLGYSYNKTTGEIIFTINGVSQPLTVNGATTVAGLDPDEFDIYSSPTKASATAPDNTGPTTFGIDNYVVEASNNATLGVSDVKPMKSTVVAIGPNPAENYLNILTGSKINKVDIFDMSGKKVNVKLNDNQVDIQNLSSGSYIINVETKDGKVSDIFIKK